MILSDVFERFAQDSPLTVMARGLLENALNPTALDQLFEDVADQQYTKKLLFSSVVDLMSLVVCGIQPALNAAYKKKFGFPFIIAVRLYTKEGIFFEFERRLRNDTATEYANGLENVFRIARLRLDKLLEQS